MLAKSLCGVTPRRAQRIGELRRVPLIPDARALFERMRSERADEPLDAKVFRVRECQKALDRACKKVGTDRITHHDLRHLFATRCIESGVDIPTVSPLAWTQRRRRVGNENLRPFAARAQHCTSAARDLRACRDKAGRRDRVPGYGMTSGKRRCPGRKEFFSLNEGGGRPGGYPQTDGAAFVNEYGSKIFKFRKVFLSESL